MNAHQTRSLFEELEKLAEEKDFKERAMSTFVKARPYAAGAAKAGIPAALAGKMLFEGASWAPHAARTAGIIGATAGVANEALKEWARRKKRGKLRKEILKQGSAKMRKVAAMATDLRRTGIGGVKRPPFATEDSKRLAFKNLNASKKPGQFFGTTQARHLRAPGPSISQISPRPLG